MLDVISMIHRDTQLTNGRLNDFVDAGRFKMSIQAGVGYQCSPKIDGLAPYLYDTFEVAVYPFPPKHIDMKFSGYKMHIYGNVPKNVLQKLYEMLCAEE